jgi:hypothetical protein
MVSLAKSMAPFDEWTLPGRTGFGFVNQKGMVALASALVRIHADRSTLLIAVHGLHRRVKIQDEVLGQQWRDDLPMKGLQLRFKLRLGLSKPKEFLVQQRVMRETAADKALEQVVVTKQAKVEQALTAQRLADDKHEQNTGKREQGIAVFVADDLSESGGKSNLIQKIQKGLDSCMRRGMLERKFSFNFGECCGRLHL